MANWTGLARTNYFRVKDEAAFLEWVEAVYNLNVHQQDGLFMVYAEDGWPSSRAKLPSEGDVDDEVDEFDFVDELYRHLADGEVLIGMEAGHEKARYVSGHAFAVRKGDEILTLSIGDSYNMAKAWPLTNAAPSLCTS